MVREKVNMTILPDGGKGLAFISETGKRSAAVLRKLGMET